MRHSLLALIFFLFVGCAQRIGDFTIVSTKNYESSKQYKKVGRFVGEDNVFFFIIPFGIPNIKNACDRAIESGKGVYMTDAVLESVNGLFNMGYRVTGDVWVPATQSDLMGDPSSLISYQELVKRRAILKQ